MCSRTNVLPLQVVPGTTYFATKVLLGAEGVAKVRGQLGPLEQAAAARCAP
jgi:hypothetical protein